MIRLTDEFLFNKENRFQSQRDFCYENKCLISYIIL